METKNGATLSWADLGDEDVLALEKEHVVCELLFPPIYYLTVDRLRSRNWPGF